MVLNSLIRRQEIQRKPRYHKAEGETPERCESTDAGFCPQATANSRQPGEEFSLTENVEV